MFKIGPTRKVLVKYFRGKLVFGPFINNFPGDAPADKIANMMSLSKSISYLLDKFADTPSNISGKIIINQGILTTEKLLIDNKKEKALLSASLDLKTNIIDGKIDFYENEIVFLTAQLKGNLENPKILIGGEVFAKDGDTKPKNIKKIFEEGIQSLINNLISQ